MAVQRLDIKRPGHWTVLKVQFCLVMTVLVPRGPPVIIKKKKRGFWWGRTEHKSFISFKANGLPRFISLDLSDRTIYEKLLTMSPRLQHERIPYGLNIRGKKKRKQKHLYFPALLREQTCQNKKTRQFFGYCFCFSFLLWDRQHGRKDTDLEIEKPGFRLLALLVVIWVAWGKSFGLSEMHQ